jgi:hypothetical protein
VAWPNTVGVGVAVVDALGVGVAVGSGDAVGVGLVDGRGVGVGVGSDFSKNFIPNKVKA